MPQQIDVPGMGIVEFPDGMSDADMSAAIKRSMPGQMQGPPDERSFFDKATSKVGSFLKNVYENPPPIAAAIGNIIKEVPQAATELTWGDDPEAAKEAAGTMLGAASMAVTGPRALQFPVRQPVAPPAPAATGALEAAGRIGVDVPRYLATEGNAAPMLAAGIKNVPYAGQPIERSAQGMLEQMGGARGRIAGTPGTAETAGEGAATSLSNWIKTGSQQPVGAAYEAVGDLINPATRVPLNNTADTVAQIMAERTAARLPGKSKAIESVMQAVQDPTGMDYAGTKLLRTSLGERTPQELAVSGISPVEHKRIYGALSKDLGNVVREAGGPQAFGAWQEANALARLTNMQRQALGKIVGPEGQNAPEAVFSKLLAMAGSKSTADINRLMLAKRAMGPEAWNEIGSAIVHRMGGAPDGSFSADRFVTAYSNLSPRAKGELFTPAQRGGLEDLFAVSKFVQQRVTRYANPSGTARGLFGGGLASAMFADPISVVGGMVGSRLVAEALSRPAIAHAAADVTRAQLNGSPVLTQRAMTRLYQLAVREGLITQKPPQLEYRRPP
jgi:hypothetical protein